MGIYISGMSFYKPSYKDDDIIVWSDAASLCIDDMLKKYSISPKDIELLVSANETSDFFTPQAGCIVREKSKLTSSVVFNLNTGLGGINSAISIAEQYIKDGTYKNAVVVFGEIIHNQTEKAEEITSHFRDGIGCLYITSKKQNGMEVLSQEFCSCGENDEWLKIRMSGTKEKTDFNDFEKGYNKIHSFKELDVDTIEDKIKILLSCILKNNNISLTDINKIILCNLSEKLYSIQKKVCINLGTEDTRLSSYEGEYYFGATQIEKLEGCNSQKGLILLADISLGMEISFMLIKNGQEC